MNKSTLQFLAAFLSAAAAVAAAHANGAPEDTAAPAGGDAENKPRRGRPPGGSAAAPAGDTATGPTDEERLASNQALIKPLIDDNKGEEVKAVIAKYSKAGLKGIPTASQAAFAKDIEALTY